MTKTCDWCGTVVPPERRKTCSPDCADARSLTRRYWDRTYAVSQRKARARWTLRNADPSSGGPAVRHARRVVAGEAPEARRAPRPGSQAWLAVRDAPAHAVRHLLPRWVVEAVRG